MADRKAMLLQMWENDSKDDFICFALAKEYEKEGDLVEAKKYYETLQSNNPDYVGLYYHLGKLLEAQEDPTAAFQTYKTGMTIAKKIGDQHALSELATAKLELGDDEDFE